MIVQKEYITIVIVEEGEWLKTHLVFSILTLFVVYIIFIFILNNIISVGEFFVW